MKKYIVITSVFSPTEAVLALSKLSDYKLIVVGDRKTTAKWSCEGVEYLSIARQKEIGNHMNKLLPYNHYCRKMMGYLRAIIHGADIIIDTDDDNIPKKNWGFPDLEGEFNFISPDQGFVNIYKRYSDKNIWPRGLPLNVIVKKIDVLSEKVKEHCNIGVWQGLSDENPDVDAIYRLTNNSPCFFNESGHVVLGKNTMSPYNSQNTLTRKELFHLLYLPAYVSFRFTDILRGLVAQPIMWLYGYNLGFTHATMLQKRNVHDYYEDFISEIPMHLHGPRVIEIVSKAISSNESIGNNLYNAYEVLQKNKIIPSKELKVLDAWLKELESLQLNT